MNDITLSESNAMLFVKGDILFSTVVALKKKGDLLIKKIKCESLVINLSHVEKSDITGLTLMMSWYRLCQRLNIHLTFHQPPESILKMADVCGVKSLLKIENN